MEEEYWDSAEAGRRIKKSVGALAADRHRGQGPPYVKVGRFVRYRRSDVEAWMAANVHQPELKEAGNG